MTRPRQAESTRARDYEAPFGITEAQEHDALIEMGATVSALHVFSVLRIRANPSGKCGYGIRRLAKVALLNESTVASALKWLVARGVVYEGPQEGIKGVPHSRTGSRGWFTPRRALRIYEWPGRNDSNEFDPDALPPTESAAPGATPSTAESVPPIHTPSALPVPESVLPIHTLKGESVPSIHTSKADSVWNEGRIYRDNVDTYVDGYGARPLEAGTSARVAPGPLHASRPVAPPVRPESPEIPKSPEADKVIYPLAVQRAADLLLKDDNYLSDAGPDKQLLSTYYAPNVALVEEVRIWLLSPGPKDRASLDGWLKQATHSQKQAPTPKRARQ